MRVSHSEPAISATFDDPNLVSRAGLAPAMALAQRAGLGELVADALIVVAAEGAYSTRPWAVGVTAGAGLVVLDAGALLAGSIGADSMYVAVWSPAHTLFTTSFNHGQRQLSHRHPAVEITELVGAQ